MRAPAALPVETRAQLHLAHVRPIIANGSVAYFPRADTIARRAGAYAESNSIAAWNAATAFGASVIDAAWREAHLRSHCSGTAGEIAGLTKSTGAF